MRNYRYDWKGCSFAHANQCLKEISPALLEIARTEESKVLSTKEFFKQAPRYKTDKANKEQR